MPLREKEDAAMKKRRPWKPTLRYARRLLRNPEQIVVDLRKAVKAKNLEKVELALDGHQRRAKTRKRAGSRAARRA